jgi:squalene-hopene/tetraprenyl-beta-curcumene cyclase
LAKAKEYLLKCQAADGGFSYGITYQFHGDVSNTFFSLKGLSALGVGADSDVFKKALDFVRRCQDHPETNPDLKGKTTPASGGAWYKPDHSPAGQLSSSRTETALPKPYGSMTAVALSCYLLGGLKPDAPEAKAALKWLSENFSGAENPGLGQQGYYYYAASVSKALSRAGVKELDQGGKPVLWAWELGKQLRERQDKSGCFVNQDPRWLESDKVLSTTLALQALNVCIKDLKSKK